MIKKLILIVCLIVLLTGCSTISDASDSVGFNSETVEQTETINESDEKGENHYYTEVDDSGNYSGEISKEEYEELVKSYSNTEAKEYQFNEENIRKIVS